jgi:hypothetical protein
MSDFESAEDRANLNVQGRALLAPLPDSGHVEVFDPVQRPRHYNSGPPCVTCGEIIECIVVTEPMSFCKGNVVKYLWRADHKGSSLEDLRKARWYLEREIARLEHLSKAMDAE